MKLKEILYEFIKLKIKEVGKEVLYYLMIIGFVLGYAVFVFGFCFLIYTNSSVGTVLLIIIEIIIICLIIYGVVLLVRWLKESWKMAKEIVKKREEDETKRNTQ